MMTSVLNNRKQITTQKEGDLMDPYQIKMLDFCGARPIAGGGIDVAFTLRGV